MRRIVNRVDQPGVEAGDPRDDVRHPASGFRVNAPARNLAIARIERDPFDLGAAQVDTDTAGSAQWRIHSQREEAVGESRGKKRKRGR